MRCFITGAAGYIGSSLIQRLHNDGHEVTGLIHHHIPEIKDETINYITGDITKASTYQSVLDTTDVIVHCAAIVKDYGPRNLFEKINYNGTKTIADLAQKKHIPRFIFLGHIQYELTQQGAYNQTKIQAEHYLQKLYQKNKFPYVSIRPGNVYGPGPTTWVIRPLTAIQNNRIALIDNGTGIFHHTYIDNLIDAILLSINTAGIEGNCYDITDGDTTISWKQYFNDLAQIIGKPPISKKITKTQALFISKLMHLTYLLFHKEPWITTPAVHILTNQQEISISPAQKHLQYKPKIKYQTAIKNIETWINNTPSWQNPSKDPR